MRRLFFIILPGLFIAMLAACGGDSDSKSPTETPANTDPGQGTLSPVLIELQREYELLEGAHQAMSDIWEGLAAGESVACGDYPTVPAPDSIRADDDSAYELLAETLRRAAIDLDHATNLWKAECNKTRPTAPPDVIDEGRLAVRAAGDSLKEAAPLLGDIQ